ncbi:MAG: response regulator [Chromatiales bacterium]|jgi:CheY-like chemotaxis protein
MPRITPHNYLRIGSYSLAVVVFGLLLLFLVSTPLDPLIQIVTLIFYATAILAMGGILRNHFTSLDPSDDSGQVNQPAAIEHNPHAEIETESQIQKTTDSGQSAKQRPSYIILLTRQDQIAKGVQEKLLGWNHGLDIVRNCAEASQQLLNRLNDSEPAQQLTLIVDAQDLEIDPIHLPALIQHEASLKGVKLICIATQSEMARSQQMLAAGYSALLKTPIDKSQLFSAINAWEDNAASSPNVVNLALYRLQHGQTTKKSILLADRQTAERKRIAALLQAAGHRVKTVETGEQALDALEQQYFDVVLLNLQLPILHGTQVIKLHRFTTPYTQWASFIVMTDQTTPATLRLCRDLQVRACLFKPVPSDALLEMINEAPVIPSPEPATIRHITRSAEHNSETRFLHADLLDTKVLQVLGQLDTDRGFVPELIAIFRHDSIAILQGLEDAVERRDTERFIELSNILMDNAGQLGAFALYEICLTLQRMNQQDLNTTLTTKLSKLHEIVDRTNEAFQHYLSDREQQHTDSS